jgi:hypothetical protein
MESGLLFSQSFKGSKDKLKGRELGIFLSSRQIKVWLFWEDASTISTIARATLLTPLGKVSCKFVFKKPIFDVMNLAFFMN